MTTSERDRDERGGIGKEGVGRELGWKDGRKGGLGRRGRVGNGRGERERRDGLGEGESG